MLPPLNKNMHPKVSVIVPTYNRPERLRTTLESIRGQTYSDFEVIVVNDGGADAARNMVEAIGDQRFTYCARPHAGRSAARNHGLRRARGTYVTFCDDDDELLPTRLERHLKHLMGSDCEVSCCNSYLVTGNRQRLFFREAPPRVSFEAVFYRCNPPIHSFLLSKQSIESVGGFDENVSVCEDYDLWLRLLRHYRFSYLHEPLVQYDRQRARRNADRQRISQCMSSVVTRYFLQHQHEFSHAFKRRFHRLMWCRQMMRKIRSRDMAGAIQSIVQLIRPQTLP